MSFFSTPAPNEVFTPGEIPLEETNVYVSRSDSEKALKRAIDRNWCPVVFGDYGVGKTTLVLRYFRKAEKEGRLVYFESAADLTMPKVFEAVLEALQYEVTVEEIHSTSSSLSSTFGNKILKAEANVAASKSKTTRLAVSSPTDKGMLNLIGEARLVLVVDEMHRASDQFRADLTSFIKVSRVGAKDSTLVLVGTSADPLLLVASDPGIDRFVKDTPVTLMSEPEATKLVTEGFGKLKLTIDKQLIDKTVTIASGAPSILQTLCLDMAEHAVESHRKEVVTADLTEAVKRYLDDNSGRMTRRYFTAIETQGPKRYRKQVLHAVARLERDYATMDDLRREVSAALGEKTPATALSGPLRALKEKEYGSVLQSVERDTGGEVQNVSSFTDPMMKSFVRFMETLTRTDLIHEDEVREALGDI